MQPETPNVIDKTMSMTAANLWANLLAIPLLALFFAAYHYLQEPFWPAFNRALEGLSGLSFLLLIALFFGSIVIHELLHAVGFLIGGAKWQDIKFGIKSATPFAHCKIALPLGRYRLAVILPGLILGILPAVAGIAFGSFSLLLYGALMSAAALGDALILWLLRDAPPHANVLDHPSKVGCELYV